MAFHPEDRVVASCSEDKSIKLWNLDDGRLISTMSCDSQVNSVVWSPDGAKIVAGSGSWGEGKVWIFDSTSGALIGSPLKVGGDVPSIDFAPCGNKFAIACNNYLSSSYSVQIFSQDGSTGNFACQSTLTGHTR